MHKLIEAAGRRSAGLAAGVILTGGMVGGVLLAPGAAYASPTLTPTTTTVGATAHGSTVNLYASVSPSGGGGSISVSSTFGSCTITLGGGGMGGMGGLFGGGGPGGCQFTDVHPGTYTVTATYTPGNPNYSGSSASTSVTVSPSTPTPGPYGPPPQNNNNYPDYHHFAEANLSTSLYCTSPVHVGGSGSCTLWVSNSNRNFFLGLFGEGQDNDNFGQGFAADVTAKISLPWPLRAEYCSFSYYNGCHIYGNTAYENLGNLYPGQTRSLTVHFRVSGFNIWGYDNGNPFLVIVHGSASSDHDMFNFFGRGESFSTADVWIRPYFI